MRQAILTTLIAATFLIGCHASKKNQQAMDSWIGSHKSALIQSWGPPSRYESDGKGGEILIYERSVTRGSVVGNTYYENTRHPYQMFYADSNGKIYYWRTGS